MTSQKETILVTGGGGFIGGAIARWYKAEGYQVRSLSRGTYPELERAGIECCRADLGSEFEAIEPFFHGVSAVFHVAAKVDMWGPYEDFFRANVLATRNVLRACEHHGVSELIFTSSPSVIASGKDLKGVDESQPYPCHYDAWYPATKAQAEREVIAAHAPGRLATVALRPHLVWGPGDTNLVPTILARAQAGRLVQVGSGENMVDTTFIEDCVRAHVCARSALQTDPGAHGGRAYFISQGEPVNMWGWINEVLQYHHLSPITRRIPHRLARLIASISEGAAVLFRSKEPLLTRFLVDEMATHHYFDISAAKHRLGYQPQWSIAAAMEYTFSQRTQESSQVSSEHGVSAPAS